MINIFLTFPIRLWDNWQIYIKNYKFIIEFWFLYNTTFSEIIKFISLNLINELNIIKNFKISNTKNKAFSSYSNKKLRQQKGSGKARIGSKKSVLQKGGSVAFGLNLKRYFNPLIKKTLFLILKYLCLNKRTNIYIININTFNKYSVNFKDYLKLQVQLNGILIHKLLCLNLTKNNLVYFKFTKQGKQINFLKSNKLTCLKLLSFKYIFIFI
ncbi:ribosomal protein L4 (apicoplast) [Toxoplasma gondii RH]|uniref:Large ribosomal subunit protein uL4m n=12 Tax=Toxoplasma gondii TaxID=5811 RepID=Q9MTE6_TOXGO|nr:ribosomal protein L4 [Toxoplasma gondii RH]AAD41133.1 ribosomal protein L4 [Toxoplasma gondii]EPR56683.1 ribosomal protein L4 [Toxoplasma gondii GT1]KFG27526.1 ribosomal protein L4 [Toxoplasma gondii p89]KFG27554.1 ribosomal protein L4 [Toxoplasma gondii FOU]KFG49811.1 ribosomal protein L4 [Toxoplasma gondii RUB]KFG99140.1 ribosomal protein L4 [Toxoplasma gondii VAND]KFG99173.1 ribosomal protein L4 [Toxoplasma gondii MAS]PIL95815.1 ribosomal protein L4 [Toxoplasma gondii COUG]PUA92995.1|eukprot:NP_044546.1 ribosomal protein L4 (apicoplast) [Toxoplasma gondii RH]